MKTLAIDTSTYTLGAAVLDGEQTIGEYITNLKKNHSLRAMPAIDLLLKECELKPADLDKIVVAKGPGSYTGVRIGVTIAKTLAWSLGIPLSGISSLAALAASAKLYPSYISPLFDARRGRVYTGLYRFENGQLITVKNDQNLLLADWCQELKAIKEPVLFAGKDVTLHEAAIKQIMGEQAVIGDRSMYDSRPSELGRLGMNAPAEDVHAFVPNYIRLAEAEAKWLEAQEGQDQHNG
ncbi:tRNA (adenosine(37)-N6)-threonylcarbamoyltransferase complex dimerization subunit type 1 TsaB [Bacillus xiapuensis]|uniref:tRNA (adenosine(37)-N6)-threonylcarbamoyltransferase complex dimerization subunit type 1 TsaB n=1 Tax=Bacillus xiapuensis TaxID=2014075 RepID=UPI000C247312|nr:tRNA (adenosine(37)-N6)-threonylcarbamoyltransferase complex dimerization subunit type 1 TsaB [Bacillus xiapuensis]